MGLTYTQDKPEYHKTQAIFGNTTLGVVIPKKFAANLGIEKGDYLRIVQDEAKIVIQKAEND